MSELAPDFRQQFCDSNGAPLVGGSLHTYAAGTTTPLATYTDSSGTTPNTNPIILDAYGGADIWLGGSTYKFVLKNSSGTTVKTVDNVQSVSALVAALVLPAAFQKVTISYTQLQTAGTSNAIALFTIPALSILDQVIIKHTMAFAGTSISALYAQIGPSGAYDEFIEHFDILQTVADSAFDNSSINYIGSFATGTTIYLNAQATGANLSALTQGSLDVYYQVQSL